METAWMPHFADSVARLMIYFCRFQDVIYLYYAHFSQGGYALLEPMRMVREYKSIFTYPKPILYSSYFLHYLALNTFTNVAKSMFSYSGRTPLIINSSPQKAI